MPDRILVAAVALLFAASCARGPQDLRFVTPAERIDAEVLEDLGERLNEYTRFDIRMTGDSLTDEAALDALVAGDADVALVSNNMPFREGVETVMPLYPTLLHIAYRIGRETGSPGALLEDAKVYAGEEGSASRLVFEQFIERLGLNTESFTYSDRDRGDLDADVIVIFAPLFRERVETFDGYRLLSLGSPEDIGTGSRIDGTVLLQPTFRHFVIPEATFGDLTPEPVVTVAVDRMLVARHDLPATTVYDFINEVLRMRPPMSAKWPGLFNDLSEDFDVSRSSFNLHAGTLDYLQRSAPTVYERYSGVAEVIVTLFVALVSASVAGVRIYQRYRKNRIDSFCMRAIELRDSVADDADYEVRKHVIQKVHELQREAFGMLADEKLAADESFQIFITLSNDVIRQIDNEYRGRDRLPA